MIKHEQKPRHALAWNALAAFFIFFLTSGCAALSPRTPVSDSAPLSPSPPSVEQGWWSVRFRIERPVEKTRWAADLLIAHRIVAPIQAVHGQDIALWRFHRRSGDDDDGHRFSFIFFADAAVADRINRTILEHPLLQLMLAEGLLRDVIVDTVDHNDRPAIADTSDRNWSPIMQAAWPYYIMGVSRMWLEMIDRCSLDIGTPESPALDPLITHYEAVNAEVTRIWQQEGYHALLHHLNAIYGYGPLIYWEKRWKSF